jgi:hypothetical protein
MSTSLVHILTVIGRGAADAEAACEELLCRRIQRRPRSYGSEDWTERDYKDIEHLCQALVKAARKLPVHYYAQYLDPWTVADSIFGLLKWPDGRRRQICGACFGLAFYPSRFAHEVLAEIEGLRLTEVFRSQAEDRWFLEHVKEAIDSALWLRDRFLVVCVSEVIGPSRHDDEVKAALELPLGLSECAV